MSAITLIAVREIDWTLGFAKYLYGYNLFFWRYLYQWEINTILALAIASSLLVKMVKLVGRFQRSAISRYLSGIPWWGKVLSVLAWVLSQVLIAGLIWYETFKTYYALRMDPEPTEVFWTSHYLALATLVFLIDAEIGLVERLTEP